MSATNESDFDRVLAEWLDEGPHRAPDRPIEMAIQHARSHPRRRDPVGFLRVGAMSSRPRYAAALQPAWMLLVLGLLLAAVAAFWVGSSRPTPIVVPPLATPSPEITVPPTPRTFNVQFVDENNGTVTIEVVDGSGFLVSATGGEPMPDVVIPDGTWVGVANGRHGLATEPPQTPVLRLAWGGCPSEDHYTVRIDSTARDIVVETAGCTGDTLGVGRTLTLTFAEPVPAGEVTATLVTAP